MDSKSGHGHGVDKFRKAECGSKSALMCGDDLSAGEQTDDDVQRGDSCPEEAVTIDCKTQPSSRTPADLDLSTTVGSREIRAVKASIEKCFCRLRNEVRRARGHELQKAIRKLKIAKQTDDQKCQDNDKKELDKTCPSAGPKKINVSLPRLELRVKLLNRVCLAEITKELAAEAGIGFPPALDARWKSDVSEYENESNDTLTEAAGNSTEEIASADFIADKINRIKVSKTVVTAMRRLQEQHEQLQILQKKERNKRKRVKRNTTRKTVPSEKSENGVISRNKPCGIGMCTASFTTSEGRAMHWRKRHAKVFEDRVLSQGLDPLDPHSHIDLEDRTGKNRMGQRERQRRKALEMKQLEGVNQSKDDSSSLNVEHRVKDKKKRPHSPLNDSEKIHPSWQAKRNKQVAGTLSDIQNNAGSHVVFSDADDD